jgi:predicted phosphodiesterase
MASNPRVFIPKELTHLYYLSDTHLEELEPKSIPLPESVIAKKNPDEVIGVALLGDIGWFSLDTYWDLVLECIRRVDVVILILGNHEYHFLTLQEVPRQLTLELARRQQIHPELASVYFLENSVLEFANVRVWGSTFWTKPKPSIFMHLNDRNVIKDATQPYGILSIGTIYRLNETAIMSLENELGNGEKPLIVLTHHAPTEECNGAKFKYSKFTSAFVNSLPSSIWQENTPMIAWLYGHTHQNMRFEKNKVVIATNAYGYDRERLRVPYEIGAVFSLPQASP